MLAYFGLFALFWTIVYVSDCFLKSSQTFRLQYTDFLNKNGLYLSMCQLRWQTTAFNRAILKIGRMQPMFLRMWFDCGVLFGVISMLGSVTLLTMMILAAFRSEKKHDQLLQPMMPGMNLPWNEMLYYILTLIIAGIFHELGHAVAAIREHVSVKNFGLFLFLVYPGAFVELHTEQLEEISPFRKLRIFCAGVWHNFLLAMFMLILSLLLPHIVTFFYIVGNGVVVTWIHKASSIASQLQPGDVVRSLNNCPAYSSIHWQECLQKIQVSPSDGFCNSKSFVTMHSTTTNLLNSLNGDCCNDESSYRFCFFYDKVVDNKKLQDLKISGELSLVAGESVMSYQEYACLPARLTIEQKQVCQDSLFCGSLLQQDAFCLKPLVNNSTKLVRINYERGQDILFVGNPSELLSTVTVSDHVPKYLFSFINLPEHIHLLCMYIVSVSSALAILNMVPCYLLDGHQALCALMEIVFPINVAVRTCLTTVFLLFGSILLFLNIILGFYTLLKR